MKTGTMLSLSAVTGAAAAAFWGITTWDTVHRQSPVIMPLDRAVASTLTMAAVALWCTWFVLRLAETGGTHPGNAGRERAEAEYARREEALIKAVSLAAGDSPAAPALRLRRPPAA